MKCFKIWIRLIFLTLFIPALLAGEGNTLIRISNIDPLRYGGLREGVELRHVWTFLNKMPSCYEYKLKEEQDWERITPSVESINKFLSKCVTDTGEELFVNQHMQKFLHANLSDREARIIDEYFLKNYFEVHSFTSWFRNVFLVDIDERERVAMFKSYLSKPEATFVNNSWTIITYIKSRDGGVERMKIKGTINPLQISEYTRSFVQKPGWLHPTMEDMIKGK